MVVGLRVIAMRHVVRLVLAFGLFLWIAALYQKKVEVTFENAFFGKFKKKRPIKTIALRILIVMLKNNY